MKPHSPTASPDPRPAALASAHNRLSDLVGPARASAARADIPPEDQPIASRYDAYVLQYFRSAALQRLRGAAASAAVRLPEPLRSIANLHNESCRRMNDVVDIELCSDGFDVKHTDGFVCRLR
jgi:hypothetical protein